MPVHARHGPQHGYSRGWYGWGSPGGLGLLVLCLAISTTSVLAALSLF